MHTVIEFLKSAEGLIATFASLLGAVLALLNRLRPPVTGTPGKSGPDAGGHSTPPGRRVDPYLAVGLSLLLLGIALLVLRFIYRSPEVAITAPAGSVAVTAEKGSVWFPVSGTSEKVFGNPSLRVYVLTDSGTGEWHVQNPASLDQAGNWALGRAWLGSADAPVGEGSVLQTLAVVSSQRRGKDDKVADPGELEPLAMSPVLNVSVRKVQNGTALCPCPPAS